MNQKQAYGCIAVLSAAWPRDEWSEERAAVWVKFLAELDDHDTAREAVENLVRSNKFPPALAEIREEYLALRRSQSKPTLTEAKRTPDQVKAQASKIRDLIRSVGLR